MTGPLPRGEPDRQSRARRAGYDPEVLADACVLVVGAGALGQNVLLDLGLSGVRELRIVDGDVFEDHNLTRSPLFPHGATAAGLPKASAVAAELAALQTAPEARVRAADDWIEGLGLGAFAGVDAIAACVDSMHARAYLAKVALLLGLPIVDGGFSGANVGMTAYPVAEDPTAAPCWRCGGAPVPGSFSCRQFAEFSSAAGVVPAIQNGAAVLAGLLSEAVVQLLHGRLASARRVSLDIRTGESLVFEPGPAPDCAPNHRRLSPPVRTELEAGASVAEFLGLHGDEDSLLLLPDVFVERATCPSCLGSCEVEAPAHRWRRDPRCERCDGPWRWRAGESQGQDVVTELHREHPRAGEPLADFGVRAGDLVEIQGRRSTTVEVAGDPESLWASAPAGRAAPAAFSAG